MSTSLYFLLFIAYVSADTVKFIDCGSSAGTIQSIDVNPCPGAPAGCVLKKGTSPTVTINFTPNAEVTSLKAKVYGILGGAKVPFPLPNPDGCKDSGLSCPLAAQSKDTYTQKLDVKTVYPSVRVIVEWHLVDQDDKDVACFRIQAKVSD